MNHVNFDIWMPTWIQSGLDPLLQNFRLKITCFQVQNSDLADSTDLDTKKMATIRNTAVAQ